MKIIISILFLSIFCLKSQTQSIDTLYLNSKWKPVKEKRAKYFRTIQQANDTLFKVSEFSTLNTVLMKGEYSSLNSIIENGSFTFYEKNTEKIKAFGRYSNGIMVGDWIYFDQSGDSTIINYDYVLVESKNRGYSPNVFIHPTMPIFNGSDDIAVVFRDYIKRNKIYPALAELHNIEGRVIIQFAINPNGQVSDLKVMESANKDFEREALRVIANSPDWIPGKYGDKATTTMLTFPVYFEIDN